mmetsp:Transcript_3150/g.4537  ORF Transcript_3150/g.4537 Transcript_3150/m.4537 type:complete len:161 (-) Transcript_3150:687-1169(-)
MMIGLGFVVTGAAMIRLGKGYRMCSSKCKSLDKVYGVGKGGQNEIMQDEFCCLFYGYKSPCLACPLPKSLIDLIQDGSIDPNKFARFGERASWEKLEHENAKDCFRVLGLSERPRTVSGLKKAFKQKALGVHPDVGGSQAEFLQLVAAYETCLEIVKLGR